MAYMLLIVEPVGQRATRTRAEGEDAYARMKAFGDELHRDGLLLACESLKSQSSAARVERRAGKLHTLDGPFAEAKEMVGGFYLLNCNSRSQAMAIAARCPAVDWCSIEVRELGPCYDESNAGSAGAVDSDGAASSTG